MMNDRDADQLLAEFQEVIDREGWAVIVVPDDGTVGRTLGYTVGLTVKGLPELVMMGPLNPMVIYGLLNEAAEMELKEGTTLSDILAGDYDLKVVEVDPARSEMNAVAATYPEKAQAGQIRALQLVWPIEDNTFPALDTEGGTDEQPVYKIPVT